MGQVCSQPKVAGYSDNRIIQDRIKEAPLYHCFGILTLLSTVFIKGHVGFYNF